MFRIQWLALVGGLALVSSGCCWWADKMCPQQHCYPAPAAYAPQPQCCAPCTPACSPYTPAWTPAPANYPTAAPVARPAAPCTCP